jgi:glucokinase
MRPARASFGVAGVVRGRRVPRINLPWELDAVVLEGQVGLREVILVNDVEANARGILALGDDDFSVLHPGAADAKGTRAVVAAGTGLGEAALWWDGTRHHPRPARAGPPHSARRRSSRSSSTASSPASEAASTGATSAPGRDCETSTASSPGEARRPHLPPSPPRRRNDPGSIARAAVDLFISAYGARAGDVALSYGATGGVYLGGGIAPKLLPQLMSASVTPCVRIEKVNQRQRDDRGRPTPTVACRVSAE